MSGQSLTSTIAFSRFFPPAAFGALSPLLSVVDESGYAGQPDRNHAVASAHQPQIRARVNGADFQPRIT